MRSFVRYLLWLYVFSMPWDTVSLPVVGSVSRLLGMAVLSAATLATILKGSFRKPDVVVWCTLLFVLWNAMTLSWTVSYNPTMTRIVFYAQVVISVLMMREFVRTDKDIPPLLMAYCLGAFVPIADLLNNYRINQQISMADRFSGAGVNADTLGSLVVIGLPMAWYLVLHYKGVRRAIAVTYLAIVPLAVMLTGTRGAFLAGLVALSIIPLTLRHLSFRTYAIVCLVVVAASTAAATFAPANSWTRLLSIPDEISGGSMTGRRSIWQAGMQVFWDHPFIGVGAGAYGPAVQRILNIETTAPHSLPIGVLVETGVIGAILFAALIGACLWTIMRSPKADRQLWGTVLMTWMVGAASANWESVKITWLLFALISCQNGLKRTVSDTVTARPVYARRPRLAVAEPVGAMRAPARG